MITFEQSVVILVLLWALWFHVVSSKCWVPVSPIERKKFSLHHTQGGYGGAKFREYRIYIIAGGSGFIGSWIARYLLARGEPHVYIFDRDKPPSDLIKHGVNYVQVDLTHSIVLERELGKIIGFVHDHTKVVVYNCCVVKKLSLPNFRADLGIHAVEMLYIALRLFGHQQVILIHVGDSLAHRLPVRNWDRVWPTPEIWHQMAASDLNTGFGPRAETSEDQRDRSFSSYSWHQLQVETMTLQAFTYNPSIAATAVLRIEGFTSGHLGDGFLSPVLRRGRACIHSPHIPITLVHVEDVVRGCLSLEHMLMDPATQEKVNGRVFTIGSREITTLQNIFEYCKQRRPSLSVWNISPSLVFLVTCLMGFIYTGKPVARRSSKDTPLDLGLGSLTFSRFYTMQVGQVPNPQNIKRQHEILSVRNNFSLSQTLDTLLDEIEQLEPKTR